jgi:polar amino acid transport system substrate-binding protein
MKGKVMKKSVVALLAVAGLALSGAAAHAESTWAKIMKEKKLKACVTQLPPNSFKDPSGTWHGFVPLMAKDLAASMGVEHELVETTWKTVVVDVQSGRCDVILGLTATPERALALDFAGPLYSTIFSLAPKMGRDAGGDTWEALNKPENRISVVMGTAQEQVLNRYLPKTSKVPLTTAGDAVLAVQTGRADFYMGALFDILAAKGKGPVLGAMVIPKPEYATPSYAGIRFDDDNRFAKFIQRWADYRRAMGNMDEWIIEALVSTGSKREDIPPGVKF